MTCTRREMLAACAAALPALASASFGPADQSDTMGVADASFSQRFAVDRAAGVKQGLNDPRTFLEYCTFQFGAGGVQTSIGSRDQDYATRLRERAAALGRYIEGSLRPPRDAADVERFTKEVNTAKEAGARVVRTVLTSGRRYEAYTSMDAFRQAIERANQSLVLAEPVVARADVRLAVENHKDFRIPELLALLKRANSKYIGVCVDVGNSIALLEDPMEVVEACAPWAFSVHLKDMAVAEYDEGFLLAEVPLGQGFLDLPKMVGILRKARPEIHFNLEMITRDPLKVPCLTPKYHATFDNVPARDLAGTLAMVRKLKRPAPTVSQLPKVEQLAIEEKNVKECLDYARKYLGL